MGEYNGRINVSRFQFHQIITRRKEEHNQYQERIKEIEQELSGEKNKQNIDEKLNSLVNFKPLQELNENLNSFCVAKKEYEKKAV